MEGNDMDESHGPHCTTTNRLSTHTRTHTSTAADLVEFEGKVLFVGNWGEVGVREWLRWGEGRVAEVGWGSG